MDDKRLKEMLGELIARGEEIPSVFGSFKRFSEVDYPAERREELLESARKRFARGDGPPQLPLAPGINLRWNLPDSSQESWFVTVRDDDDPTGFFTIRVGSETAGLLATWCVHLQRIKVPEVSDE